MIQTINQEPDATFLKAMDALSRLPSLPHPHSRGNVRGGLRLYSRDVFGMNNFHFYRFVNKQLSQFIPVG